MTGADRRRRAGEGIGAGLGLGEGDHLADVGLADQQRGQAVDAEGEPAVGRHAVAESVQEEPEPGLDLLRRDAQQLEDAVLDGGVADPDRARAQLPAVEDQVIGLRAHRQKLGAVAVEHGEVVDVGHGERMMRRHRQAVVAERLEQREVDHPHEAQAAGVDWRAAQLQAQQAEHATHQRPLVGDQKHHVAGGGAEGGCDRRGLLGREQLGDAAIQCRAGVAGDDPHPGQAFGPPALGGCDQGVDLGAAQRLGPAGQADALHARRLKHPHRGAGENLGQLDQLHAEAHVGLVGAEALHGVVPGDHAELAGALAADGLGCAGDGVGDGSEHVVSVHEAHLGV